MAKWLQLLLFSGCLPLECTSPLKTNASVGYTVQLGTKTISRDKTRAWWVQANFNLERWWSSMQSFFCRCFWVVEIKQFIKYHSNITASERGSFMVAIFRTRIRWMGIQPWRQGKNTTGCQIASEWLPNAQMDTMAKPRHVFCNKKTQAVGGEIFLSGLGDQSSWSTSATLGRYRCVASLRHLMNSLVASRLFAWHQREIETYSYLGVKKGRWNASSIACWCCVNLTACLVWKNIYSI